ncbi:MAG: ABC transporter substrate-binding protein [Rhodospirillales bacterium]|nr:ABC transporter substrate-binding protein [Rhodospirillales bacterium]
MPVRTARLPVVALAAACAFAAAGPVKAQDVNVPILVPITGFLSIEGTSQRNGALLAVKNAPAGLKITAEVADTGVAPEVAVNALERALGRGKVQAVAASMLGTQMLAMLPVALENKVPLVTVSGTAQITEMNNPYVFRFFPGDDVTKVAHVKYAVEELGKKRVALIYQTTAYGQSGRTFILKNLEKMGLKPVFEEALETSVRDMSPVLGKAKAANPDVVLLHLHGPSTGLVIKQAAAMNLGLPIVAGSAMHQPHTAHLMEPAELKGVCAETSASPVSGGSPELDGFLAAYRKEFNAEPDGFALGQYDAVSMVLAAAAKGAKTAADVQKALATTTYKGLAMTYKSDGKGNMAHSAMIICYDGASRIPKIVKRYENITGVL